MSHTLYAKIIDALVEDGYIIIENALNPTFPQSLREFLRDERAFKKAGVSSYPHVRIDRKRRRDKTCWLEEDGAIMSDYLAFMAELQHNINRDLFMGLSYYESHFAIYDRGDFYETHYDAFKGFKNRVVTTVYYLNKGYKEGEDGGELIIYDENNNMIQKVFPHANTLVVFLSDKFPHEVLPAKKKRYSIAGWFRVDKF
ncbi:MAG: 2OG-Fe(II) oxygenase [Epsilonproteobacteria bacterium]|nr:2OG-Fe(II) oxygenase [Campylobacterota bacterium]OIO17861.1 MAG: proline hydroxylase [Helicobacteraceae bacterium CG1_02_36_14]PIP10027.1 MAG: proline hydroxylase [Sulfurimonas sp. CG23_combo_of_CG06-09_8_20_14_all_36_33]PIS25832.1 MAG: proline hydroxylase [Sulfurimonas sp. CG08_land_8_20_14_0_20_36_33]PIU35717.1 MAG: proline hydroxylase [Sulfurimonas sp. CG07_land_8_20_14_0_80_36_56]PIV05323.1 MAG: proline hydroxylase [Sulfurimonas sp. CG03_land_8_20_14_0_80_36_25]PIV35760.1 MAG: proline 